MFQSHQEHSVNETGKFQVNRVTQKIKYAPIPRDQYVPKGPCVSVPSTCGCTSDTAVYVIDQSNKWIISVIISEIHDVKNGTYVTLESSVIVLLTTVVLPYLLTDGVKKQQQEIESGSDTKNTHARCCICCTRTYRTRAEGRLDVYM